MSADLPQSFTNDALTMMLQIQVEEMESSLSQEIEQHQKASRRATAAERRVKHLMETIEHMEGDLNTLAQCWSCTDLGNKERCSNCSNSAVFQWNGTSFEWRGISKKPL